MLIVKKLLELLVVVEHPVGHLKLKKKSKALIYDIIFAPKLSQIGKLNMYLEQKPTYRLDVWSQCFVDVVPTTPTSDLTPST